MLAPNLSRQSFLGSRFDEARKAAVIAILGVGGGGSHVGQQLAHLGFENFELIDPQTIEDSNLNRLVGGTQLDVDMETPKALIAERLIRSIRPGANVHRHEANWHQSLEVLKGCDIVFGCLDSFVQRDLLESFCRRYRILLIDMGMTVREIEGDFRISGQVIASIPGRPCMRCMGFINDDVLKREAEDYGAGGPAAQVVWANGTLASAAVGFLLAALADWNKGGLEPMYLEYDGNSHTLGPSNLAKALARHRCIHYPEDQVGDVDLS